MKQRHKVLAAITFGIVCLIVLGLMVMTVPAFKFRDRMRGRLQQAGILPPPAAALRGADRIP